MSAELAETMLRAAALMRERAARAGAKEDRTPESWYVDYDAGEDDTVAGVLTDYGTFQGAVIDPTETETAQHIASWHPAVALAVAGWLESTANDVAHVHDPIYNLTSTTVARAIKVARTYLGES